MTKYAFGDDRVNHTECPARAAGFAPREGDASTIVAEHFDEVIENRTGRSYGTVDEDVAKDAWNRVIEHASTTADRKVAREIAEELGWK